jgi:hypothetical protein
MQSALWLIRKPVTSNNLVRAINYWTQRSQHQPDCLILFMSKGYCVPPQRREPVPKCLTSMGRESITAAARALATVRFGESLVMGCTVPGDCRTVSA